ncbi:transposase [Streptomyces sp. NPDC094438]|uniref:transposase n=1 Tax=Streptomyces sp. NPDC094438 TaxID=3366061 RepID=UPI00380C5E4E
MRPSRSGNDARPTCQAAAATRRERSLPTSSAPADKTVEDTVHHTTHQVRNLQDRRAQDNGRKRHLIVDMRGMPLAVMVDVASPHDSVPARDLLFRLRLTHPEVTVVWGDSAYGGPLADWARSFLGLTLKTVPRRKDQDGFAVLAKRWRVERAISWVMRARRNVRDYERLISHSEAHLTWTFITLMARRLTQPPRPPRTNSHPVEPEKPAGKPMPIRLRTELPRPIRLAPAALR